MTISGGYCNCAEACGTFIGGGRNNCNGSCFGSIVGGRNNCTTSGAYGFIGGGCSNRTTTNESFIGGGSNNLICSAGLNATIGGGKGNCTFTVGATIGGGCNNSITDSASYAAIGGGCANVVCCSSPNSAILGGRGNIVAAPCSVVLGGCGSTIPNVNSGWGAVFGCNLCNTCANSLLVSTLRSAVLSSNGQVYSNTCSLTNTNPSDRTLKCNITASIYGLCELKQLKPVRYKWVNGDGKCNLGFIAQDVKEVLPSFVGESEDKTLGLYSDRFTPLTVKAVQELNDKLTAQEERITMLEDILKRNNLI
jgi:hypothetical protein